MPLHRLRGFLYCFYDLLAATLAMPAGISARTIIRHRPRDIAVDVGSAAHYLTNALELRPI